MAYNDNVKLRAYTLFLQGQSFEEIARIAKKDFALKSLKGQTVKAWAEAPDHTGFTWEDHRIRVRASLQKNVDRAAAGNIAELRDKTKTIHQALFDQLIKKKSQKISSFEGAIYAFKTLSEFLIKLDAKERSDLNPLIIVQMMLEIFREIPQVRKSIEQNWDRIQEGIRLRLEGPEKAIEVNPVTVDE